MLAKGARRPGRTRKRSWVARPMAQVRGGGEQAALRQDRLLISSLPPSPVFTVPHTPDMLTSIFAPNQPKTALDILTITSLTLQIVLFFVLSGMARSVFFLVYFAFWRGAYNGGLGFILKAQSEKRWIVKTVKKQGWMDAQRKPKTCDWIRHHLKVKMEDDYDFEVSRATRRARLPVLTCTRSAGDAPRIQRLAHVPIHRRRHSAQRRTCLRELPTFAACLLSFPPPPPPFCLSNISLLPTRSLHFPALACPRATAQ